MGGVMTRYSDQVARWLAEDGYTHCFFVAGGNIMHILDSCSREFVCVPFVHEVSATIAAEYFNEVTGGRTRAFALVTAGPGLTNALTGMAGAFLESRDLLVIGGQVKSPDLSRSLVRQRGIQEIDGIALAEPVSVAAARIERPVDRAVFAGITRRSRQGRPGPVFVEFCLDAQSAPPIAADGVPRMMSGVPHLDEADVGELAAMVLSAERPVVVLGGGVSRQSARDLVPVLERLGIPTATTWNGADRIDARSPVYAGRPNTWGMRWANLALQQADLVIAFGSRLGLQQSGFNWQSFAPVGRVIQVDLDAAEILKGHPRVDIGVNADANTLGMELLERVETRVKANPEGTLWVEWLTFVRGLEESLPVSEASNQTGPGYVNPYEFVGWLSDVAGPGDTIVPCSSGGAFTVTMQAFRQQCGQVIVTDKGLASMGYGLAGAIGAALADPQRRVLLVEGDGGFAQNLQELGTAAVRGLNLKVFIFDNDGYASIRMTQRNYYQGRYVGCDGATGLGLPAWETLAAAYGIPCHRLTSLEAPTGRVAGLLQGDGPALFIVPIDPEQTYFPKIASRVTADGGMESAPLHDMSPPLRQQDRTRLLPYLPEETNEQN